MGCLSGGCLPSGDFPRRCLLGLCASGRGCLPGLWGVYLGVSAWGCMPRGCLPMGRECDQSDIPLPSLLWWSVSILLESILFVTCSKRKINNPRLCTVNCAPFLVLGYMHWMNIIEPIMAFNFVLFAIRDLILKPPWINIHMSSVKTNLCAMCVVKHFLSLAEWNNINWSTCKDVCLYCMHSKCGKFFKSTGDLNRHVRQHDIVLFYYCDFCTYKNADKRNTESHMGIHVEGNKKYSCQLCGKQFRFSTQKLRHKRDGCNLDDVECSRSVSPDFWLFFYFPCK